MTSKATPPGDNGDTKAPINWEVELANHRSWLRTVIAARLSDRHAIDDVFQEVALAAVEQRSPITDRAKIPPWLYRLAVVHAIRHRRQDARRRNRESIAASRHHQPIETDDIPIHWLLAEERREMVQAALQRLPVSDAEILALKYFDGLSYRQLAERLGVSEKTIDNRLHRARNRLRGELQPPN